MGTAPVASLSRSPPLLPPNLAPKGIAYPDRTPISIPLGVASARATSERTMGANSAPANMAIRTSSCEQRSCRGHAMLCQAPRKDRLHVVIGGHARRAPEREAHQALV